MSAENITIYKPNFKRFNDLRAADIDFDFHIHTNLTDGKSSIEEIINQAKIMKLRSIAITEHVRKTSGWFDEFKKQIEKKRVGENINLLIGIEAKAVDLKGNIDATDDMIQQAEIVIGSVHSYPHERGGFIPIDSIESMGKERASKTEYLAAMGLLQGGKIDILGHPFGMCMLFFNDYDKELMEELFKESLKNKIAIEINTKYISNLGDYLKLINKVNPYVSIGSDSHYAGDIGRDFDMIKAEVAK